MTQQQEPMPKSTAIGLGAINIAVGFYFILVAFGVLPIPGGPGAVHGPEWIVFCAGLAFLLAGVAIMSRAVPSWGGNEAGDLPADAPRWAHAIQYAIGLGVGICLASIGTWIAIGAGARQFDISAPFFGIGHVGEGIGRAVFGIGAIVVWLYVIALLCRGLRKLFGRAVETKQRPSA